MIKLIESKLFGDGLLDVTAPLMVKRYNACLEAIGIEPTKLKKFHVDGWGWSPEISEEKGDRFYLSHGISNPYGIILSPLQKECALYMPYHTFDWAIHQLIYKNYELQILDITSKEAIWFELDQGISAYRDPHDILMVDVVQLRFTVSGDIQEATIEQKELVAEYNDNPRAWLNPDLRKRIIASSKAHGDLRYRNVQLPDHPFTNLTCFYSIACGGLFVFKKVMGDKPVLIFEDNSSELSNDTKHLHVEFNLDDHSFIPYLYNLNLLDSEPDYFKDRIWILEQQLEHMVVAAAMKMDDSTPVDKLTKPQRKGLINKLNKAELLDEHYFELEQLVSTLKSGNTKRIKVSNGLNHHLLQPHKNCAVEQKAVIWQLIAKLQGSNPVLLYAFDKSAFYSAYQEWSEPMQNWAIKAILKNRDIYQRLTN